MNTQPTPPPEPIVPNEARTKAFAAIDAIPDERQGAARVSIQEPVPDAAKEPAAAPLAGTPAPAATAPPPAVAKPSSPLLDDLNKLSAPKPDASKPAPEAGKKKSSMEQFRTEYETLKAEHEAVLKWKSEHEPKLKELAGFDPKKVEEEWSGKLTAVEQKALKAEEELRYANYQRSTEFKEKYEKPLIDAIASAQEDLKGITVKLADGSTRPATMADIESLQKMPTGQAALVANEAFGPVAPYVMKHRDRLNELHSLSAKAVEEYRTKGSEREAQMRQAHEQSVQKAFKTFDSTMQQLEADYPEMFGADPADPSSKELLSKGTDLVSMAFKGAGIPAGLTPEERDARVLEAQIHTATRARAYGPTYAKLQKSLAREAELAKKLEAYEKADPDPTKPSPGKPDAKQYKNRMEEVTAGIDSL